LRLHHMVSSIKIYTYIYFIYIYIYSFYFASYIIKSNHNDKYKILNVIFLEKRYIFENAYFNGKKNFTILNL